MIDTNLERTLRDYEGQPRHAPPDPAGIASR